MYKLRNRMSLSKTDCEKKHKNLTKKQKKGPNGPFNINIFKLG